MKTSETSVMCAGDDDDVKIRLVLTSLPRVGRSVVPPTTLTDNNITTSSRCIRITMMLDDDCSDIPEIIINRKMMMTMNGWGVCG